MAEKEVTLKAKDCTDIKVIVSVEQVPGDFQYSVRGLTPDDYEALCEIGRLPNTQIEAFVKDQIPNAPLSNRDLIGNAFEDLYDAVTGGDPDGPTSSQFQTKGGVQLEAVAMPRR